jgi:hypothetical protein
MELAWTDALRTAAHLATGASLAACAGLRAFLPLFAVGLAGRLGVVPLSAGWSWLAESPALWIFGAAVLIELAADKIPLVDHVLDAVQVLVKPLAGALVMATALADTTPLQATVLAILAGGAIAGGVHLVKAKLRLLATAFTAGTANPLLSAAEDLSAATAAVLALIAPLLALAVVGAAVSILALALRRGGRRAGAQSAP